MLFIAHRYIIPLICWMILFLGADPLPAGTSGVPLAMPDGARPSASDPFRGYTELARFRESFIGVGTDGRIDRITPSGESVLIDHSSRYRLNGVTANDDLCIAVGDHGTILVSTDGKRFNPADSGTDKTLHEVTMKNGLMVAGTDEGIVLVSNDAKFWGSIQTAAKGRIISLSANESFFIGITDAGEIIKSSHGVQWDIQDYNQEYAGYNRFSTFKKILAAQNNIVIIGQYADGSPSILFSSLGDVWAERLPYFYDDRGKVDALNSRPNSITYDPDRDQFILACDRGDLFSLPSCKKCNEYTNISEKDLHAILYADHDLVIAGDDFSVFVERL